MTKAVRILGVALLALWTLHTVVITGRILLDSHYKDLLSGNPQAAVRAPLSALIQNATPRLVHSLPARGSVLVLVDRQELGGFAYFWLTYWLYPRHVELGADLNAATTTSAGSIIYFQRPGSSDLTTPDGYQLVSDSVDGDGAHVLVLIRVGGSA